MHSHLLTNPEVNYGVHKTPPLAPVSHGVDRLGAILWGTDNFHVSYQLERTTPKVNIWSQINGG
jgi:hypothetical protein